MTVDEASMPIFIPETLNAESVPVLKAEKIVNEVIPNPFCDLKNKKLVLLEIKQKRNHTRKQKIA